ncbi:MAG: hypothetical protein L6V78_03715 [Clostridium sp.]|nr:MAG: hypothetical protein L6V78_03715 [Clostridium sp.]
MIKEIDITTFHKLAINIIKDENYHLAGNILDYIINEYFESYAKTNKKTNQIIKKNMYRNNHFKSKKTYIKNIY